MNNFKFGKTSNTHLANLHPALVRVAKRALVHSKYDFGIICSVRTAEEQQELVDNGDSLTLDSKHLVQVDGSSHALDFMVYVEGKGVWQMQYYRKVMQAFVTAAIEEEVQIELGGLWEDLVDGCHVQLTFL